MDMYGSLSIDDLLHSSSSSSSSSSTSTHSHHSPPPDHPFTHHDPLFTSSIASIPSDEWLSQFVYDSFHDFPANQTMGGSDASSFLSSCVLPSSPVPVTGKLRGEKELSGRKSCRAEEGGEVRRCSHCASEKTPQWRTGPLGPKTLCNACGVRYKSGRLVPEYRPAASPTFVLTQHSNSHRKVMELRRQKELQRQQQQQQHDFKVC